MSKIEYANIGELNPGLQAIPSLFGGDFELSGGARSFALEGSNGVSIVFKGAGFDYDADGEPIAGRASSCQIIFKGERLATITDIDVGAGKLAELTSEKVFVLLGKTDVIGSKGDDLVIMTNQDDAVRLGDGDDFAGTLYAGGDDTIFGGRGDDTIYADAKGAGRLDGGRGTDTLDFGQLDVALRFSLADDDTVDVGAGKATVSGFENLSGGALDDRLTGDEGANWISGAAGEDTLVGGGGHDTLVGGGGAAGTEDVFLFNAKSLGKANEATIIGFIEGEDLIDISKIDADAKSGGNQDFSFIGERAFSGAAGELRWTPTDSGGRLAGDVNGDGKADFFLKLREFSGALSAGDFDL